MQPSDIGRVMKPTKKSPLISRESRDRPRWFALARRYRAPPPVS